MKKTMYITTTLPYVNALPHIGFAMEIIFADAVARYQKKNGVDVFLNTGTDEHGMKVYRKALEEKRDINEYVDYYASKYQDQIKNLSIMEDINFVRTTDIHHKKATKEFWKLSLKNGDIYKKNYRVKYCVGCELEITDSELVDDVCPIHPTTKIEFIDEENYFFRWSKYQDRLLKFYKDNPDFVYPEKRFNEVIRFVENGLEDFSISRLKEKMPWGVDVPDDDSHVMYVWFDALVNYISVIGWPDDEEKFTKYWPGVVIAGKDNVRQQSAMWVAMLFSVGLPPPEKIIIHGFINVDGQKMSKSLGNVIEPNTLIEKYGTDAFRFFCLKLLNFYEDSDYSDSRMLGGYNAYLANGIGNLVARILKMSEDNNVPTPELIDQFDPEYSDRMEKFDVGGAIDYLLSSIKNLDQRIQKEEPFKMIKENKEDGVKLISELVLDLYSVACMLEPIMPKTSQIIKEGILQNKKPLNLFERK